MSTDVVRMLDTSPAARHVAAALAMQCVTPAAAAPDAPVLTVIADTIEVSSLPALRANHHLVAVVAWGLAEADLLRLLDGATPVIVGQPTPQQLRELVWWGETPVSNDEERARTTTLAVLEDVFDA